MDKGTIWDRVAVGLGGLWLAWSLVRLCVLVGGAGDQPALALIFTAPTMLPIGLQAVFLRNAWSGRRWAQQALAAMSLLGPCFLPLTGFGLTLWGVLATPPELAVRLGLSLCFGLYWVIRLAGQRKTLKTTP